MDEHDAQTDRSEESANDAPVGPDTANGAAADPHNDADDTQQGKVGDALAWLEGPAFDSPIEEMPTLQWPDVEAEAQAAEESGAGANGPGLGAAAGPGNDSQAAAVSGDGGEDDLEDAMQWLEELAREQGTPLDEMPTLISTGERTPSEKVDEIPELGATTPPPQMDSDPMAWLEQLAMDQDSPLEELPSVADRLLASEIASQTAFANEGPPEPLLSQPVELEEALRYLEEQAAAEGLSLQDVTYDEQEAIPLEEEWAAVDRMAVAAAGAALATTDEEEEDLEDTKKVIPVIVPDDDESVMAAQQEPSPVDEAVVTAGATPGEPDELDEAAETTAAAAAAGAADQDDGGSVLKKVVIGAAVAKAVDMVTGEDDEPQDVEAAADDQPGAEPAALVTAEEGAEETIQEERTAAAADVPPTIDEHEGSPLAEAAAVTTAKKISDAAAEEQEEVEMAADDSAVDDGGAVMPAQQERSPVDEAVAAAAAAGAADQDDGGSVLKKVVIGAAVAKAVDMVTGEDDEPQGVEAVADDQPGGQPAVGEALAEEDILDRMPEDPDEAMAWMGAMAEDGETEAAAEEPASGAEAVLDEDTLDDMPDDPDEAMRWMAALAAKEAAARHSGAATAADEAEMIGEAPEEGPAEEGFLEEVAPDEAATASDEMWERARSAFEAGEIAAAAASYRALLEQSDDREQVITALEAAVEEQPQEPALREVLGDAYMQGGQMQKALRAYREGLTGG